MPRLIALSLVLFIGFAVFAAAQSSQTAPSQFAQPQTAQTQIAQTNAWLEVRTPSFVVVSNASEKDARRVARQFEQMRSVFHRVFPAADLDTATPITVIAVTDKQNLQALEPPIYLGKGQVNLSGLFLPSSEKNYVLIWMAGAGRHPYAPIFHEYTHFVMSRTGEWMPGWLSEGLAQFYENTEILDGEVRLGEGSADTLALLQRTPLLPLPTLFAVDQHSPYYHEENKATIFYAESWALTHYLKMKDEHENTHCLDDYLALVNKRFDLVTAATQAFGDLDQLQIDLRKYIVNGDYSFLTITGSTDVDDASFGVRTLTQIEVDTIRGDFLAHDQREADAKKLLESVLREDPDSVAAREGLGIVAYQQQHYAEAENWCEQAAKLDPGSFFAHYCFAAAAIRRGTLDSTTQTKVESSLRTSIKINPSFALAYDALGMLFALRGKNLDEAYESLQKAVQLDPGTVEIRIDEAQVLMRMNHNKEATDVLDLALKMAHTPEQTAAVETVQQSLKRYAAERAKTRGQNLVIVQSASATTKDSAGKASTAKTPVKTGDPAVSEARAIYAPQPDYTEEARAAHLQGTCVVSLTVGLDGTTSNIVVVKKLGMGLDEKAVEAVKKWRFQPALRYGRPVLTHLTLSLQFKVFGESTEKFFDLSEKAKTGDPAAEFELAKAFFEGREIPKDEAQGLALLERAARDGMPQAQFQMGERTYGDGTNSENYVTAYVWYALAQRGGIAQSDEKLADLEARMTYEQLAEAKKRVEATSIKGQ